MGDHHFDGCIILPNLLLIKKVSAANDTNIENLYASLCTQNIYRLKAAICTLCIFASPGKLPDPVRVPDPVQLYQIW